MFLFPRSPSPRLPRRPALLQAFAVVLLLIVVATFVVSPAAHAQDDQPPNDRASDGEVASDQITDIEKLQARLDELPGRIAETQERLQVEDDKVAELAEGVASTEIQLELLLDELTRAVEARDTPKRIQRQAAIARYVYGDPSADSLLDEIEASNSGPGPDHKDQLYTVVIEDAASDVERARARLRGLGDAVDSLRNSQRSRYATLDAARSDRATVAAQLARMENDITRIGVRIEWLESLKDRWLLTGLPGPTISRPAVAMKIDNVDQARPQVGLNKADVVFEELVEDGRTRLVAVYHSETSNPVGPIRSTRTSDIEILSNLNSPLFGNSGGNDKAMAALRRSSLIDAGANAQPKAYFRDSSRARPHNLFTNVDDLLAGAGDRSTDPSPQLRFLSDGEALPSTASPVKAVTVRFAKTSIEYRWNGSGWARTQNGTPHVDADGVAVAPPNVIIQFVGYRASAADARSPEAAMVGGGEAWILTQGQVIEGTWNRQSLESHTVYEDQDANLLELTPGKTWITLARGDRDNSAALVR